VADGVCHLGIVGENVVQEKYFSVPEKNQKAIQTLLKLGFGSCRLSIAVPEGSKIQNVSELNELRIATSYPSFLSKFLRTKSINAKIVELSGSVEIAPQLKIADAICDLISTGGTLKSNGLRELISLFESQAVLIRTAQEISPALVQDLERLLQRANGVIQASQSKYIMMNAPRAALPKIKEILPGMENPSVMSLGVDDDRIAIHTVAHEGLFWETIENLKAAGASSILVLPIEKVVP
jgi:ATP phosphoribosyltransferase